MTIKPKISEEKNIVKKNKKTRGSTRKGKDGLTFKQRKFVRAYVENGGNGVQAAMSAYPQGYASADTQARANLEKPLIKKLLAELIDKAGLSDEKIAIRLSEGADATDTRFLVCNNKIHKRTVTSYRERRMAVELAMKAKGHLVEKVEHSGNVDLFFHAPDNAAAVYRRVNGGEATEETQ